MKKYLLLSSIALLRVLGTYAITKAASPSTNPILAYQRWVVHGQAVYRFTDPDNNVTCYIEGGADMQNNQTTSEPIFCLK
jgi:hypothetical protein